MVDKNFDISFYKRPDGTKPAQIFIKSLEPKMRAKIAWLINALETCGNSLREPYSKHLDDGIFELRAKVGSDISRVLYFFVVGQQAVLTHGFVKKTNKTPPEEIKLAKKYREDFLAERSNKQ